MRALVNEQVANFKRNFEKVDLSFARRKNLTAYDVLIIASLIEREAMVAKERSLIASVIYNRLSDDIPLGIDATVRFVTNNWKRPLRQSELANPEPLQHARARGPPAGADRQPRARVDQGRSQAREDALPLLCRKGRQLRRAQVREDRRRVPGVRERVQPCARRARRQVSDEVLSSLAGVLGFPVGHSRSPAMMNAAFAALGLEWRYLKLPVTPARFERDRARAPRLGLSRRQRHDPAQARGARTRGRAERCRPGDRRGEHADVRGRRAHRGRQHRRRGPPRRAGRAAAGDGARARCRRGGPRRGLGPRARGRAREHLEPHTEQGRGARERARRGGASSGPATRS